jgi:exopolysaccharide biosynthesis polyprenyl glycosylphosphotransferase
METNAAELRPTRASERWKRRTLRAGVDDRRRASYLVPLNAETLVAALLLAEIAPPSRIPPTPIAWLALFLSLTLLFCHLREGSTSRYRVDMLDEARGLILATTLAAMTVLSARVLLMDDPSAAAQTARMWAFASVCLVAVRVALASTEVRARRRGERARPTLIVGAGEVGQLAAKRLREAPELGLRPIGFLDKPSLTETGNGLPVLGASWDLERVVRDHQVRHAIFTFSTAPHQLLLEMVSSCHDMGVSVSVVPRLFERMTTRVRIDHVGALPLISVPPVDPKGLQFRLKYFSDRLVGVALLIAALPLLAIGAAMVWVSLGRPILYRQVRVGRDGTRFEMLKFRSMLDGGDNILSGGLPSPGDLPPDTAPGGVEGDDRRTRVGKVLRRSSLDELPQLINVLRGEMSLVGPRPERPEFTELFQRDVYRYGERLRVKSGITGWAQVHGLRGQTSLADRVEWDNYYIENWSFWLDVKIMLLTARSIFRFAAD